MTEKISGPAFSLGGMVTGQIDTCITGRTTDNGVGKRSQAGLSLLEDIDSSTIGFCAILSRDLVAQERSLSLIYGRPVESCSSLEQMYFRK